jgi:hypothetical protein
MAPPPIPVAPVSMDMGTPSGMGNAFTKAVTNRPVPADIGSLPQPGNAFSQGTEMAMANPGMASPRPPMPATPGGVQAVVYAPGSSPWQQSLTTLRDSIYPSEREWAVEHLGGCNWKIEPAVVQALMTSAKDDPAPAVRAACVRVLAHLKVNTLPVVQTVQALASDPDARVRQEVEQALPVLSAP